MENFPLYIQIVITTVCTVAYILTFLYQRNKINTLTNLMSGQSRIISDFEKYKSLFSIEDFEKRLTLKLDNQKDELHNQFRQQTSNIIKETNQQFALTIKEQLPAWTKGWEELLQIATSVILKQYPSKEHKLQREEHIKKYYPQNAEYLIGFINDYLNGQNPPLH